MGDMLGWKAKVIQNCVGLQKLNKKKKKKQNIVNMWNTRTSCTLKKRISGIQKPHKSSTSLTRLIVYDNFYWTHITAVWVHGDQARKFIVSG